MLNSLKGSRSRSRKGQGHWRFLPVFVKSFHLLVLNVACRVWVECGIFLNGQGQGHAKVKVKGMVSPCLQWLHLWAFCTRLKYKVFWSSESCARFKVKVMQVSRSYDVFDCGCYTY